jgi:hypothetical protein
MHTATETNPLVAFIFTILLVAAVLIGSAATNQGVNGGMSASAGIQSRVSGPS